MAKKKQDKRLILALVLIVLALAAVNLLVFTSKPPSIYCYLDLCVMGGEDPIGEINALISSSTKAILVVEGDNESTQKSGFVSGALVTFAKDFGSRDVQLIGIKFEGGVPVECICTDMFKKNFTDCPSNTTSYCESVAPGPDEMMLKVYYPDFSKNEIIIDNRTVRFQAKSGQDAFAMATFFGDFFVRKVI